MLTTKSSNGGLSAARYSPLILSDAGVTSFAHAVNGRFEVTI
jgi:hypothetical protein